MSHFYGLKRGTMKKFIFLIFWNIILVANDENLIPKWGSFTTSLRRMVRPLDFRDQWKWAWFCQNSHSTLRFALIFIFVYCITEQFHLMVGNIVIKSSWASYLTVSTTINFFPYFQLEKKNDSIDCFDQELSLGPIG